MTRQEALLRPPPDAGMMEYRELAEQSLQGQPATREPLVVPASS
ncbi:MAG: hypothetical protein ACLQVF_21750 [Isosphaeraceae bacterium]